MASTLTLQSRCSENKTGRTNSAETGEEVLPLTSLPGPGCPEARGQQKLRLVRGPRTLGQPAEAQALCKCKLFRNTIRPFLGRSFHLAPRTGRFHAWDVCHGCCVVEAERHGIGKGGTGHRGKVQEVGVRLSAATCLVTLGPPPP